MTLQKGWNNLRLLLQRQWVRWTLAVTAFFLAALLLWLPLPHWIASAVQRNALTHVRSMEEIEAMGAYSIIVVADEQGLTDDLEARIAALRELKKSSRLYVFGLSETDCTRLAETLNLSASNIQADTLSADVAEFLHRVYWIFGCRTAYLIAADSCFIPSLYLSNKAGTIAYGIVDDPNDWQEIRTAKANRAAFWRDWFGVRLPQESETESETTAES